MLKVLIHPSNIPEKEYIINILLTEFLGLNYSIEYHCSLEYCIIYADRKIIFEDSFWGPKNSEDYLKVQNIPQKIKFLKNEFTRDEEIPLLYGSDKMEVEETKIYSGFDIFASSFFMLTRWEEYVEQVRDNLKRYPGEKSVAFKNNFINKPVVNQYADFLWELLKYHKYNVERSKRKFEIIPTVDVDHLFCYNKLSNITKNSIGLIGKGRLRKTREYLLEYYKTKMNYTDDPYNTYKELMDLSDKKNIKIYFFFLSGSNKTFDGEMPILDRRLESILTYIKSRGHHIGFHPGFDTFNNPELWKKAKCDLEKITGCETKIGRQHYLRFEIPKTWQIWEENKMEWDCTLGYAAISGFRCGSCFEYSVFDIHKRKKLNLKEYPLLIMDTTLKYYLGLESSEAILLINELKTQVRKYNGNFIFLWHNSSINPTDWKIYHDVYEELWV